MKKPSAATQILSEKLNYGGIPTRRVDIIKDMESKGFDKRIIDWYLFCLSQHQGR